MVQKDSGNPVILVIALVALVAIVAVVMFGFQKTEQALDADDALVGEAVNMNQRYITRCNDITGPVVPFSFDVPLVPGADFLVLDEPLEIQRRGNIVAQLSIARALEMNELANGNTNIELGPFSDIELRMCEAQIIPLLERVGADPVDVKVRLVGYRTDGNVALVEMRFP